MEIEEIKTAIVETSVEADRPDPRGWELLLGDEGIPLTEVRALMDVGDWEGRPSGYAALSLPWGFLFLRGAVHTMALHNPTSRRAIAFSAHIGLRGHLCGFHGFATREDEVEFWRLYAALETTCEGM